MKLPLQVTFRHMEASDALEANIREKVSELESLYDQIMSCSVVVEQQHMHKVQGNLFHVRIDLRVPGKELVTSRHPDQHHAHEDPYVAVRDAFKSMGRQLEDFARRRRGKEKTHEVPPHGRVISLDASRGFGMIESSDGREIYFHRNSLTNFDFDELCVGDEVRFVEEPGDAGPQASSVHVVGKHHIAEPL